MIVKSRNLCQSPKQKATVHFTGQNGAVYDFRRAVQNRCREGKNETRSRRGYR
jgi:hypothetical protein